MTTDPSRYCVDLPLMTDHSIALVKRYTVIIKECFDRENPDRLFAMILNLFMEIHGFDEVNELRNDGKALFEKAKVLLSDMMKEVVKTVPVSTTAVANNVEQTTENQRMLFNHQCPAGMQRCPLARQEAEKC